jgi:uncharacterized protein (DUF1697 family)
MGKLKTYISILRGINVASHNIIKMDALRKMYEELGFSNVQSYIQSGNVVFNGNETQIELLEEKIQAEILKRFTFEVPVIVIEKSELKSILNQNPFVDGKDISKLYVTILAQKVDFGIVEKLNKEIYLPDEFDCRERAIYLYCPNGYGQTKLNNNFFENKLKVVATTRNLNTMTELVRMSENL